MANRRTKFYTRIDEAASARFYFSEQDDALSFARFHETTASESSPPSAGGGLWCVVLPYTDGAPQVGSIPFNEAIHGAIALGGAA
jgi:hypothetical protein